MEELKNILIFLIFISALLCLPFPALAERDLEIVKVLQKTEAEEKYETTPSIWENFSLRQSGSLKNETAYRISTPRRWTEIRNQFILSEAGKFSDNLRFKISVRAYYDAVFALTHTFPGNVRSDMQSEVELRDTYLDYSFGPWDLRLGKQEIVWGEAVALFFADVVNARDLREFVLPDFDMIRIPQWGADLEFSKNNFHAEFVWLPILEFDKLGVTGSEFAFPYPIPSADTPHKAIDADWPKNSFNNSEAGLRLSYLWSGLDLSIFYLHSWTRAPVNYRTINSGVYSFTPSYKRLDILGATFSKEINDIVFKGELTFNKNNYFPVYDSSVADGVLRSSDLNYLISGEYTFFNKIDTTIQFMQKIIFDYSPFMVGQYKVSNSLALWLKTGFWDNKLEPELTIVTSLMTEDLMYRPRISLRFKDNWQLRFGADIFQGKPTGSFGMFNKKSRLYSELFYNF